MPHTVNGSGGDHVGHCVLICAFMFLVPCCNVRYDFRCSAPLYPQLFVGGLIPYLCCLFIRIVAFYDNMRSMAVSFKKHDLLILHEHMSSPRLFLFFVCLFLFFGFFLWDRYFSTF